MKRLNIKFVEIIHLLGNQLFRNYLFDNALSYINHIMYIK
jgi:hypothetical protein